MNVAPNIYVVYQQQKNCPVTRTFYLNKYEAEEYIQDQPRKIEVRLVTYTMKPEPAKETLE